MAHADLYGIRSRETDPTRQKKVAAYEHRAFAREWAKESPIKAAFSLPIAIPAYTAGKALGLIKSRTPASFEEMKQGFIGLAEGMRKK